MASKKFCDRCGAEIVRGEKGWIHRKLYLCEIVFDLSISDDDEYYDLCPKCAKAFQEWMGKKEGKA